MPKLRSTQTTKTICKPEPTIQYITLKNLEFQRFNLSITNVSCLIVQSTCKNSNSHEMYATYIKPVNVKAYVSFNARSNLASIVKPQQP
jgi:hypothetical protein